MMYALCDGIFAKDVGIVSIFILANRANIKDGRGEAK